MEEDVYVLRSEVETPGTSLNRLKQIGQSLGIDHVATMSNKRQIREQILQFLNRKEEEQPIILLPELVERAETSLTSEELQTLQQQLEEAREKIQQLEAQQADLLKKLADSVSKRIYDSTLRARDRFYSQLSTARAENAQLKRDLEKAKEEITRLTTLLEAASAPAEFPTELQSEQKEAQVAWKCPNGHDVADDTFNNCPYCGAAKPVPDPKQEEINRLQAEIKKLQDQQQSEIAALRSEIQRMSSARRPEQQGQQEPQRPRVEIIPPSEQRSGDVAELRVTLARLNGQLESKRLRTEEPMGTTVDQLSEQIENARARLAGNVAEQASQMVREVQQETRETQRGQARREEEEHFDLLEKLNRDWENLGRDFRRLFGMKE